MFSTIIFFVVLTILEVEARYEFRVIDGVDDVNNEFPYVVSLQSSINLAKNEEKYRACTGTLIAPEWVITAAHCLLPAISIVRYGNMTGARNSTTSIRVILKTIPHPNYRKQAFAVKNDIGLILLQKIQIPTMGKLSSTDYKTLTGIKVRYAGFGATSEPLHDEHRPLQLGEGVVIQCSHNLNLWGPAICVVPRCTKRHEDAAKGDSGGPVFHNGKIIAVLSGGVTPPESIYTPVSPYLDWIISTMTHLNADYNLKDLDNLKR